MADHHVAEDQEDHSGRRRGPEVKQRAKKGMGEKRIYNGIDKGREEEEEDL